MKTDWEKYTHLQLFLKYSLNSQKNPSQIVNHILSFVNFNSNSNVPINVNDSSEKRKLNHLSNYCKIRKINNDKANNCNYIENGNHISNIETNTTNTNNTNNTNLTIREENNSIEDTSANDDRNVENGSDLIFDMKYCSLQLPIPLEVYQSDEGLYTLESDQSELITSYDVCFDEEMASNFIMVEPFRFLCKVHITFDDKLGHQWCCCYFDARGNCTKKRFNTSSLAFNTAKMLAHRCKEAAEHSFHNIWILKHKDALNWPIPTNLTNSFIDLIDKVKNELTNKNCPNCSINNIKHILNSF
ncbi:uncharacterized protein TA13690 [Theileria annulata]|uniref:Uncharacterized protein n=1 Tax=Theileria annulata TaxID=5874 RepID=Q4UEN5_THEAN|nr:uncharacterized protein TA13690 [Theileria annulata]CAI74454.1 hypothetical protein TA13690 [Theileria annulata]|eukprot:XP_952186.1 hypothetical protein TA13690 [Theileria annulata]